MSQQQNIKAKLKIVLHADSTIVAESFDSILWQQVFAAINTPSKDLANEKLENLGQLVPSGLSSAKGPMQELAEEIGVSVEVLQGACSPSNNSPFIHLDKHHWEAMKKDTPPRGSKSIAPSALAATLLILWKEKAKLEKSTVADSRKTLKTIDVVDNNPKRSIDNCDWLQLRDGAIIINPAETSKAIGLAKAYCTKNWGGGNEAGI